MSSQSKLEADKINERKFTQCCFVYENFAVYSFVSKSVKERTYIIHTYMHIYTVQYICVYIQRVNFRKHLK